MMGRYERHLLLRWLRQCWINPIPMVTTMGVTTRPCKRQLRSQWPQRCWRNPQTANTLSQGVYRPPLPALALPHMPTTLPLPSFSPFPPPFSSLSSFYFFCFHSLHTTTAAIIASIIDWHHRHLTPSLSAPPPRHCHHQHHYHDYATTTIATAAATTTLYFSFLFYALKQRQQPARSRFGNCALPLAGPPQATAFGCRRRCLPQWHHVQQVWTVAHCWTLLSHERR